MNESLQKQKSQIFNNFNSVEGKQVSIIRKKATVVETNNTTVEIFVNKNNRTNVEWVGAEDIRNPNTENAVVKKTIELKEMYTSTLVTKGFLNNLNESFEKLITNQVMNSINYLELQSFLYGNGDLEPEGLITNEEAQTIEFKEVTESMLEMLNKIDDFYHNNLVWLINKEFFSKVVELGNRVICNMVTHYKDRMCIFGIPVYSLDVLKAEDMAVLINVESSYCIADHINKVETLVDHFSKKPNVEFYFVKYTGGIVLNNSSYVICKKPPQ